ncbi:MAG: Xaa-Pro peptidase family protein [Candidatus Kaelpia imicola]|nr:Xaa-Pro peptidase family protein [Candidatus Kaelpia imicola]
MSLNQKRILKLRNSLSLSGFDSIFLLDCNNVRYLLNSDIEAALFISQSGSDNLIVSDLRYREQLDRIKAPGFKKIIRENSPVDELIKMLRLKKRPHKIALENSIPLSSYIKLKNNLNKHKFMGSDSVAELREIKDKSEIEKISRAVKITKDSLASLSKSLKGGMTELEVQGLLELEFRKRAADGSAFPSIVASGARSALPHAKARAEKIRKKDGFVLIDCGAVFRGYCADLTHVFFWDKIPKIVKKAYGVIEEVRDFIFSSLSEGVKMGEIAAKAEKLIERRGFKSALRHSLGHGIGIEVHEKPFFNKSSKEIFRESMVLTVEPGLYFPGIGGVRVEDVVVVKKRGLKVL